MGDNDLRTPLRGLLSELCDGTVAPGAIGSAARLREDLGLDSVALVDLAVALEERFALALDPIADDLAEAFQTVASLEAFLAMRAGEATAS